MGVEVGVGGPNTEISSCDVYCMIPFDVVVFFFLQNIR